MDNTDSAPQLVIPTIPASECPKGDLVTVLNYIFQKYLGQAVINIPGLGDVTPAEIANLQAEDISLQSQIDAINGATRFGSGAVAAGDTTVAIAFAPNMPTSSYSVNIELNDTAGVATHAVGWAIVTGTKTSSGISIRFLDIPASITTFNWSVRQLL